MREEFKLIAINQVKKILKNKVKVSCYVDVNRHQGTHVFVQKSDFLKMLELHEVKFVNCMLDDEAMVLYVDGQYTKNKEK